MLLVQSFLLVLAGISNIIVGLAVLLRDTKKLNNISFFFLSLSVGGWALGIAGFLLTQNPESAFVWAKIYYFFPLLISCSLVFFARSFPDLKRVGTYWTVFALLGFLLLVIPLIFIKPFLTTELVYHDWGKEITLNKTHYLAYSTYLLVCFVGSLVYLLKRTEKLTGFYKKQALSYFEGFSFAATLGVLFNLIFPWAGNYRLIWLGPIFTSVLVVAVAYSIAKHRMFDVRLAIARSMGYVLAGGLLIIGYGVATYFIASTLFGEVSATNKGILDIILLIFAAVVFAPMKRFFDRATSKLFYRDAYDTQEFLDELNKTIASDIELGILLRQTSLVIEKYLKCNFCLVVVKETENTSMRIVGTSKIHLNKEDIQYIRDRLFKMNKKTIVTDDISANDSRLKQILIEYDISTIVKLKTSVDPGEQAIAYLILGSKKSGNIYGKPDLRIIDIIADELVIAIQNALRFEEIQGFAAKLQAEVNAATAKLQRTNKKLRDLDETKDEFISMASHQLRTPLTSVKGYMSMVLEGDAGELKKQQKDLLNQAFVSSQRMVYLIADLLNVSRLKTGKFIIESMPTSLAEVVEGEISQLKEVAKSKKLSLTYKKPKNFPSLLLDETKIRQVIMNFADNAIYYTPSGGNISIELTEDKNNIYFTVKDNGLGVPAGEQKHLFTKFYRAKNARKARPDGTGLGLFMAKKVVNAQGGDVIFESHEGRGSIFGFTFNKSKLAPKTRETATLNK